MQWSLPASSQHSVFLVLFSSAKQERDKLVIFYCYYSEFTWILTTSEEYNFKSIKIKSREAEYKENYLKYKYGTVIWKIRDTILVRNTKAHVLPKDKQ